MKKIVAICLMLIMILNTFVYAKIYNTTEEHVYDDSLPYSDLQDYARDNRGQIKRDKRSSII